MAIYVARHNYNISGWRGIAVADTWEELFRSLYAIRPVPLVLYGVRRQEEEDASVLLRECDVDSLLNLGATETTIEDIDRMLTSHWKRKWQRRDYLRLWTTT